MHVGRRPQGRGVGGGGGGGGAFEDGLQRAEVPPNAARPVWLRRRGGVWPSRVRARIWPLARSKARHFFQRASKGLLGRVDELGIGAE